MSQPAPPQYSPDGRFYWDGQRWVPVPPPQRVVVAKRGWGCGRVFLLAVGLIVALLVVGALINGGSKPQTGGFVSVPEQSPMPIDPAVYKASAKTVPYPQLEKDPAALARTVVVYTGQVVQYDSATTTSHLRINVTSDGFGGYVDTIWLDVNPSDTQNVFRETVIRFWGEVVGPYTYQSVTGAKLTIPEVQARFVQVVS